MAASYRNTTAKFVGHLDKQYLSILVHQMKNETDKVILFKPQSQLNTMDDEDKDIKCKDMLSRYSERPKSI